MDFDFKKEPGKVLLNRKLNINDVALVSIITPYYNAGKYFEQTYNCVLNQTFPWFEWIIVNDGSTNQEDVEIIERLASTDSRIKVFHKENGGISTARNLAIKNTNTDIIIPLDGDDLIVPTYIETLYWGLYYNLETSWCYTNSIGFQNQEYLWNKKFSSDTMRTYNHLTYSGAIRKETILEVGGYDEITKHYYEDWRLWLKLLSAKKKPVKLSHYGFWYRRMDTGVLSIVNKDPKVQKLAKKLIAEVAETVDTSVVAKEYPCVENTNSFNKPKVSNWNKKVFSNHTKTNVMMLIPWMEMGGADLFNLDVVRKIDKNKFEMSILTTVPGENSWRQKFEEHVTDIFELPSFLDIENYAEFISYFIKSREIDVIFLTNSYYGYYLVSWLRKEFPHIAIVDYVHMEEWYWRNGGYARTSGTISDITEKTYVCNEKTRRVMIDNFNRKSETVETLYIGVDKEKYDSSKIEKGIAKKSLRIEINRPTILFPCRIHPQKRPFLMLEIIKEVRKKIKDIAVIVVGDGPQLEELQEKVEKYNLSETIYFAGRQNDMCPYYKDSDITLICSLKEGLSLTAYESLAMSTPVISSDVGGQSELINNEVGAIIPLLQNEEELDNRYFNIKEITSYAIAIEDLFSNKLRYENMSRACRGRIEQKFSSNIMISRLEIEFENIINKKYLDKRQEVSRVLNSIPSLVDDYMTIFTEYEKVEHKCEDIWKSKVWFENLHKDLCYRIEQYENIPNNVLAENILSDAQKRLDEIYNMRTWKLIQRYRRFMDKTACGKFIRKIYKFIYKNFK